MKFSLFILALLAVAALSQAKDEQKLEVQKPVKDAESEVQEAASEGVEAVKTDAEEAVEEAKDAEDSQKTEEESSKEQEAAEEPSEEQEHEVAEAKMDTSVKCYQCNSLTKNQETCESSDEAELKKFLKPCPVLKEGSFKGESAIGCRKIIQNVGDDKSSYVRECAYTGESELEKKRTGNKGISMYYYQCENAGGKVCNSAVSQFAGVVGLVLVSSLLALF